MIIIRPTTSLAKRMKERLQHTEVQSTAAMGDWYANDIVLNRKQFILCVSSRSRLAVVMDAAPYATFPDRLTDAVSEVLRAIGVDEGKIQEERNHMQEFVLAKTVNKSILGSLNEDKFQLEAFNHTPCFRNDVASVYQHACLNKLTAKRTTNSSLRQRFKFSSEETTKVGRLITDAVDAGKIRLANPTASKRDFHYLPYWA
jgi:hypothetical protein